MMEARELRIKNLVYHDSKMLIGKHVEIGSIECTYENNGVRVFNDCECECGKLLTKIIPFDKIEPIPLTEEWMSRFGFICSPHAKYWRHPSNDKFYFQQWSSGVITLGVVDNGEFLAISAFKFVHQLQNIHFALTGIELELQQ